MQLLPSQLMMSGRLLLFTVLLSQSDGICAQIQNRKLVSGLFTTVEDFEFLYVLVGIGGTIDASLLSLSLSRESCCSISIIVCYYHHVLVYYIRTV